MNERYTWKDIVNIICLLGVFVLLGYTIRFVSEGQPTPATSTLFLDGISFDNVISQLKGTACISGGENGYNYLIKGAVFRNDLGVWTCPTSTDTLDGEIQSFADNVQVVGVTCPPHGGRCSPAKRLGIHNDPRNYSTSTTTIYPTSVHAEKRAPQVNPTSTAQVNGIYSCPFGDAPADRKDGIPNDCVLINLIDMKPAPQVSPCEYGIKIQNGIVNVYNNSFDPNKINARLNHLLHFKAS